MLGILDRWKISCGNVYILEFIFVIITIIITIIIAVTDFKVDAVNWPGTSEEVFSSPSEENCPTRTSGLAFLSLITFSSPFSSSSSIPSWLSAGSLRCLRSPPRHLYLHHVLLLHEKGEDEHAIIKLYLRFIPCPHPGDSAEPKGTRLPRFNNLPRIELSATKPNLPCTYIPRSNCLCPTTHLLKCLNLTEPSLCKSLF